MTRGEARSQRHLDPSHPPRRPTGLTRSRNKSPSHITLGHGYGHGLDVRRRGWLTRGGRSGVKDGMEMEGHGHQHRYVRTYTTKGTTTSTATVSADVLTVSEPRLGHGHRGFLLGHSICHGVDASERRLASRNCVHTWLPCSLDEDEVELPGDAMPCDAMPCNATHCSSMQYNLQRV